MFIVGVQVFYKFFVRFVNWAVDNMLMLKNFPRNFHEERIQQLTVWTVWCVIILLLCVLTVGCNVRDNHPPPYLHLAISQMWYLSRGWGILIKLCLSYSIVYHDDGARAVLTGWWTGLGFDLACLSSLSLSRAPLYLWSSKKLNFFTF